MKVTVLQVKVVHTIAFWFLSLCVAYALFSGIADRITPWTWVAVGLLLVESVVLALFDWKCPLTVYAERKGALDGSVADLFLPKWFADRLFKICGTLYAVALAILAFRLMA